MGPAGALRRWRWFLACADCAALAGIALVLCLLADGGDGRSAGLHSAIEQVEHAWRRGPAHGWIQHLANSTLTHHHDWHPWAILFVHVPRTGGDALFTHLFPTDDAYLGDGWWGDRHLPRLYDDLQSSGDTNWSMPSRHALFKGFFSGRDIQKLREGPWKEHWGNLKTFTVLRDPVERVLSAVKHMKQNKIGICRDMLADFLRARSCSGIAMLEEKLSSYLHNAIAYQLGDCLNSTLRRASPELAVQRAKLLLRSLDFIGFYEDWEVDYYRLRAAVFGRFEAEQEQASPLLLQAWAALRRWMFYAGTVVARPRLRTRKYAAQVTDPEDWELLRAFTVHDQEVYDFARELAGRPRSPFYENYGQFLLSEGLPFLGAAGLACGACCLLAWRCRCRCCRCQRPPAAGCEAKTSVE